MDVDKMNEKERKKIWYLKNKKRLSAELKLDRKLNLEKYKKINREYYLKNKDKILKRAKEYRLKNLEHLKIKAKEWRKKNKEYLKKSKRQEYLKNKHLYVLRAKLSRQRRYKKDIQYTLATKIRRRISMAIRNNFTKKAKSTIELLGCDYLFFKKYIKSKFTKEMTWKKFLNGSIHIDHIKPCKAFDLTKPEEQNKCFHYTNLQPLWAYDNLSKGAKY